MSQAKLSVTVSPRERSHQEIAELLQKQMKESNIQWTAYANGITCIIPCNDYDEGKQKFEDVFKASGNNPPSPDLPPTRAAVNATGTHVTRFTDPAELMKLLEIIGEHEKATKYQLMIIEENKKIADKLNQLTKEDQIQWEATDRGVSCTHIQVLPLDVYRKGREQGEWAFGDNLKSYGITEMPSMNTVLGIGGRADIQPGKVKVDAFYTGGENLVNLDAQLDRALVSGVTRVKTPPPQEQEGTCPTSEHRRNLSEMKQGQIAKEICQKILKFCEQHPDVDGLKQMKNEINDVKPKWRSDSITPLTKAIELAEWKKSDSDAAKGFHSKFRGREPAVEEFYQQLAKLNPQDPSSVEKFKSFVDGELDKKSEHTLSQRYS